MYAYLTPADDDLLDSRLEESTEGSMCSGGDMDSEEDESGDEKVT